MTKFNEIKDQALLESKIRYVNEVWSAWGKARLQSLSRITNYLFVINTGALLASLTYVATKGANDGILFSMWLFAFGSFCSMLHATLDYYLTETSFSAYRKDVASFYEHKLDWEVLVDRNERRPPVDWLLHLLGWLGGLAFFVGLVYGLRQIPGA
jgi:hypothetical protein